MARNRLAARDLAAADEYLSLGDITAKRHGHCVTCNALLLPEAVRVTNFICKDLLSIRVDAKWTNRQQ